MTEDELIAVVTREIKGLSSYLDDDDYTDAVDEAERETGFLCPVTSAFQIRWVKQRTKRAIYWALASGATKKVKFMDVSRDQEFGHLLKLIEIMDKEFEKAKDENVTEFAGVSALHQFGTKIDAGFQYKPGTGRDTTYGDDNTVIIHPVEGDT